MPKKSRFVTERSFSKQQVTRWERQRRLSRYVIFGGIFVIALVIGLIGYGYYDFRIKPALADKQQLAQTAFTVNDKPFTLETVVKDVVFFASRQQQGSFNMQLLDSVVEYLQNSEIIGQEAQKLGITVSEDDITQELKKEMGGKPEDFDKAIQAALAQSGLSESEFRQLVRNQLINQKVTDEYIASLVPTEEIQVQVERIFLRTQEDATKVADQIKAGASFGPLVKDQSQDAESKDKDGNVGWFPRDEVSKTFDDVVFNLKKGELTQFLDSSNYVRGGYWTIKVTEKTGDTVKAFGILSRTENDAKAVKARLDNGEDFESVAKEASLDILTADTGGDLGVLSKGSFTGDAGFDPVVFSLDAGQLGIVYDSQRSIKGGYWVVRAIEDPQMRPLDASFLGARKREAYTKWLDEKKKNYGIVNNLDDASKGWILQKAATTKRPKP